MIKGYMKLKPGTFHETTWDAVRLEVKKIAPDIFEAIEIMSPDKSYKLYEVTYPYGASVSNEDKFILPVDGEWHPLLSSKFKNSVQKELCYRETHGLPLGMVLEGQLQISFRERGKLALPKFSFEVGSLFAMRAALDFPNKYQASYYWSLTSGARTVYMLPSIANKAKFSRLQQKFGNEIDLPLEQLDHWNFFKALANSENFTSNWHSRLLFFGEKWVSTLKNNPFLRLAFSDRILKATALERNGEAFDEMWEDFVPTIRNKKVDRYILSMARYILESSLGKTISFKIADQYDRSGPFTEIAKVICDVYGLEKYAPIIMIPGHFDCETHDKAYVSIQLPTIDIHRNYPSKNNFLMADFREILYVVTKFTHSIRNEVLSEVPMYNMEKYGYNFYSADNDRMNGFDSAETIFDNDKNLDYWLKLGGKLINVRNPFLRASVSINLK